MEICGDQYVIHKEFTGRRFLNLPYVVLNVSVCRLTEDIAKAFINLYDMKNLSYNDIQPVVSSSIYPVIQ